MGFWAAILEGIQKYRKGSSAATHVGSFFGGNFAFCITEPG